jgi:hypothetical protein
MPSKRREAHSQTAVVSDCRHHWIIDSSQQLESKGRCRLCGEERTFQNKMSPQNKKPDAADETALLDGADFPGDSSSEPT